MRKVQWESSKKEILLCFLQPDDPDETERVFQRELNRDKKIGIIVATNKTRLVSNVIEKKKEGKKEGRKETICYIFTFVIEIFARILNTNIKA